MGEEEERIFCMQIVCGLKNKRWKAFLTVKCNECESNKPMKKRRKTKRKTKKEEEKNEKSIQPRNVYYFCV